MRGKCRVACVAAIAALLIGCAAGIDYRALEGQLAAGRCDLAAGLVEHKAGDYGSNRRLLRLLDAAAVAFYCGNHEESNRYFHEAEGLAGDLWTKSISLEAASFVINDLTVPYAGEDFERALINLFSAVNYARLGLMDEALVECRRLDTQLNLFNDKYESKNVYKEDALGRYLSGMLYEASGMYEDAFIDYFKAFSAYEDYAKYYRTPVPDALLEDLVRLASRTGRRDEVERALGSRRYDEIYERGGRPKGYASIILLHFNGRGPMKVEDRVMIPSPAGPIAMAFPRFQARYPVCRAGELIASGTEGEYRSRTEPAEDVTAIAIKNLDDRKARVVAKTLARAVIKQAAIEAAASQIQDPRLRNVTRIGLNALNLAVERADTRSWRTLPAEISVARIFLPAGSYGLDARLCGGRTVPLEGVTLRDGETRFVILTTME